VELKIKTLFSGYVFSETSTTACAGRSGPARGVLKEKLHIPLSYWHHPVSRVDGL